MRELADSQTRIAYQPCMMIRILRETLTMLPETKCLQYRVP
jgi:hypothetical protein